MRATTILTTLALVAIPIHVLGQATPPAGDLELKAKKKTTVVAPKPEPGQAAKDADAATRTMQQRRAVEEAVKGTKPSRPDGDVTGGIQTKSLQQRRKP
jgi:hypothetical protein